MFINNFISMLFPKQKPNKRTVNNIKNNFTCKDVTLERYIKAFLNKEIDAKECLQAFIEYMAYDNDKHIKENKIIFEMLEDFLQDATWKTEWTIDCGDYNPTRPETWLRCIYSIYGDKLHYIKHAEQFLTDLNKEITADNVEETTSHWSMPVTAEEYLHKEELSKKEKNLREKIESGKFTPKEVILMVKDNWEVLYHYSTAYETIEYCIAASEHHITPEYFSSAFRDFGRKMGEIYCKVKER